MLVTIDDDGSEQRSGQWSDDSDSPTSGGRTDTSTGAMAPPVACRFGKWTRSEMDCFGNRLTVSFATDFSASVSAISAAHGEVGIGTDAVECSTDARFGRLGKNRLDGGGHASSPTAVSDDFHVTEADTTERTSNDREREAFQQVYEQSTLQAWWIEAVVGASRHGWSQLLDGRCGHLEGVLRSRSQQTDARYGVRGIRGSNLSSTMRRNGVRPNPKDIHRDGRLHHQTLASAGTSALYLHRRHRSNSTSRPQSVDDVAVTTAPQCAGIVWFLDLTEDRSAHRNTPSSVRIYHRYGGLDGNGAGGQSSVDSDVTTTDGEAQTHVAQRASEIGRGSGRVSAGSSSRTFNDATDPTRNEAIRRLDSVQLVNASDGGNAQGNARMDRRIATTARTSGGSYNGTGTVHGVGIRCERLGERPRDQQRRDALSQVDDTTSGEYPSERNVERERTEWHSDRLEQFVAPPDDSESEQVDGGGAIVFGQLDGSAGVEETRAIEFKGTRSDSSDDSASMLGTQCVAGADVAPRYRACLERPGFTADRETNVLSIEQGLVRTSTPTVGQIGRRSIRIVRNDAAAEVRKSDRSVAGAPKQLRGSRRIHNQMAETCSMPSTVAVDRPGIEQGGRGQGGESSVDSTILADVGVLDERDSLLGSATNHHRRSIGRIVRSMDNGGADRANSSSIRRASFMLQRLKDDGLSDEQAREQLAFVKSRLRDGGRSYDTVWRWYCSFVEAMGIQDTAILSEVQLVELVRWLENRHAPVKRIMLAVQATYSVSNTSRFSVLKGSWLNKAVAAVEKRANRAEVNPKPKRNPFDYKSVFAQLRTLRMEELEMEELRAVVIFLWQWSTVARTTNLANIFYDGCREALPEESNGRPALVFCVKESFIKGHEEPVDGLVVDRDVSLDLWQWDNEYQSRLLRLGIRRPQLSGRRGVQFGRFLSLKPVKLVGNSWVHTSLSAERIARCVKKFLESLGVPHPLSRAHNVCRTAVTAASALGVPAEAIQNGRWTNPVTMHRVYDQTMPRIATMAPELFVRQRAEESETDSEADRTPLLEFDSGMNTEPARRSPTGGAEGGHQLVEQQSSTIVGEGSVSKEEEDEKERGVRIRSRRNRSVKTPKRFESLERA